MLGHKTKASRQILGDLSGKPFIDALLVALPRVKSIPADCTFDFLTVRAWALICALGVVAGVLLSATDFSLQPSAFDSALGYIAACACFSLALRLRGWNRVAAATGSATQLFALTILVPLISVVLASTNLPLGDRVLEALDYLTFGDALTIARLQMDYPIWMSIMNHSYASILYQPLILVVIVSIFNPNHLAQFTLAWTISLCACLAVFPFVPALGLYLHHGIDAAAVQSVRVPAAWSHAEILLPARSGALRELGWKHVNGIITFPSFHVAAAILLGWGFLAAPLVIRWSALTLNALMLISAIVIGGHYLIDVYAGALVAIAAIVATERLARRQRLAPARYKVGAMPLAVLSHASQLARARIHSAAWRLARGPTLWMAAITSSKHLAERRADDRQLVNGTAGRRHSLTRIPG